MSKHHNINKAWNDDDRFAFAHQKLRAATIPARRHDGPDLDEWAWDTTLTNTTRCPECDRVFDLSDPTDADEWAWGHDCETI